jgi:hypothetical protein
MARGAAAAKATTPRDPVYEAGERVRRMAGAIMRAVFIEDKDTDMIAELSGKLAEAAKALAVARANALVASCLSVRRSKPGSEK